MSRTITILLLENSAADIERILQELHRHDLEPLLLTADDQTEYLAALELAPDLILADYSRPQFGAREALELRNRRQRNTPFIVISGALGEDKAVEMMRLGASDYLLKDRLGRLGPAIVQAIENEKPRRETLSSELSLQFSEERFLMAVESLPHPFFLYDESLCIRFANSSACRFFGLPKEQILGRSDSQLFPAAIADRFLPTLRKACAERVPASVECTLPLPVGELSFLIHYIPLLTETGALRKILTLVIDMTEWQRVERLKEDMLSAVSHEMRSPLTAIIGFSEFLLQTSVNRDKQLEYLEIIHKESERLKELVENILDLQRLKANFHTHKFSPFIVPHLLEKVLKRFQANREEYSFVLDCPINLPLLEANEAHLFRALENLLSNAVKYSEPGSTITLGARTDEGELTIWVKDQGVGISDQFHDQVFDRFFRIRMGNRHKSGGTGLGLALVKEIVQEHQGRVWVESAPEQGCTFFLKLPLKQVSLQAGS